MNAEDTAACQRAIELANEGQKYTAYKQFCALYNADNENDTTLLSWIAYTTTSYDEAERALATIARLEPEHERLDYLQRYVSKRQQRGGYGMAEQMGPVLLCPYCHYRGPVRTIRKISVGGWIWFAAFFLLFLTSSLAIVPIAQVPTMEGTAFFFLALSIVGFFLRKRSYVCSSCRIALGDIAH